ncbi:class D sortase [Heyndrickxia sporothermodurans]
MKIKSLFLVLSCLFFLGGLLIVGINGFKLLQDPNQKVSIQQTVKAEETTQSNNVQTLYKRAPQKGEILGQLLIPKIRAELPIFEGADEDELVKGVGHFSKSVLPGEKDNSVLSGHRDTVFRKLGQMKKNDLLIVKTEAGQFKYKINKIRIVDADDRTVIVPKPRATLTVTTCYPFNFIGDAPKRFILVADLIH